MLRKTVRAARGEVWFLVMAVCLSVLPSLACSGRTAAEVDDSEEPVARTESLAAEFSPPLATAESLPVAPPDLPPVRPDTTRDKRSVAQRLQDATLAARITIALAADPLLRAFEFSSEVKNGQVTLHGAVRTQEQRLRAADIARQVEGVRAVTNEVYADDQPTIRSAPPAGEASSGEQAAVFHSVKRGESLWTVAQQHDLSITQLKRLNNLRSNKIRTGQQLRVR